VNLQDDDFALFGLKQQFAQDRAAVDARWKELQREAHPDKFTAQSGAAQRIAMQWSVRINEAYQRLKDPLKRAVYLCELGGAAINAHSNTAMPAQFLMQQMEWREALEECEHCLDVQHDPAAAVTPVRALMFIEKFAQDVNQRLDQFE
jgi:molecular chaperone HscB